MDNIYYSPEAYGLTVVANIEYSDQNYCFDTRVIWRDKHNELWTARDSGCSCPTPFEEYNLSNIDKFDKEVILSEIKKESESGYYNGDNIVDAITKIKDIQEK